MVWAGPKVAIVKSGYGNLACYDWKVDVLDFTKKWVAYWTPAGEKEVERTVRKAVKLAGGWPEMSNATVVIKTNLVQDIGYALAVSTTVATNPAYANKFLQSMTVDARVVRAVALLCKEKGARKVTIVCGPASCNGHTTFDAYGYTEMARKLDPQLSIWTHKGFWLELYDVNDGPWTMRGAGTWPLFIRWYYVPRKVVSRIGSIYDVVQISVGTMKTHRCAGVTLSLKNWGIGIPPGRVYGAWKFGLPHNKLYQVITDVNKIGKVDYAVIDGLWGMEGNGPDAGEPVEMGLIIAGADPVAVDYVTAKCMGFTPENFGHIRWCHNRGVGNYENIDVRGETIEAVRKTFKPVPVQLRAPDSWGDNTGWD